MTEGSFGFRLPCYRGVSFGPGVGGTLRVTDVMRARDAPVRCISLINVPLYHSWKMLKYLNYFVTGVRIYAGICIQLLYDLEIHF